MPEQNDEQKAMLEQIVAEDPQLKDDSETQLVMQTGKDAKGEVVANTEAWLYDRRTRIDNLKFIAKFPRLQSDRETKSVMATGHMTDGNEIFDISKWLESRREALDMMASSAAEIGSDGSPRDISDSMVEYAKPRGSHEQ